MIPQYVWKFHSFILNKVNKIKKGISLIWNNNIVEVKLFEYNLYYHLKAVKRVWMSRVLGDEHHKQMPPVTEGVAR